MDPSHRLPDRPGGDDPGPGRRLGVDVGSVRIGVACSDPDGILATPVETVRRDRSGKHVRRLVELVAELHAVEVVVGLLFAVSGTDGGRRVGTSGARRPKGDGRFKSSSLHNLSSFTRERASF